MISAWPFLNLSPMQVGKFDDICCFDDILKLSEKMASRVFVNHDLRTFNPNNMSRQTEVRARDWRRESQYRRLSLKHI
jgi:hypothetical protein